MITLQTQRIFWDDGGTLKDLSVSINDFRGQSEVFDYEAGEHVYIGSELPFAYRYFDLTVLNTVASAPTVEYWDGSSWHPAVDVIDETNGLFKSGYISWKTDRDDSSWACETDSEDVDGLAGTVVYNMYWLRISFANTFDPLTTINTIGFLFSNDLELYGRYPDLNNTTMKNAFEPQSPSGTKTDWLTQHFISANAIVRDIKRKNLAYSGNQIIDFEAFSEAGQHKCAEIIYSAMGGEGYEANRKKAMEYYAKAMNQGFMRFDTNKNARIDQQEKKVRSGIFRR